MSVLLRILLPVLLLLLYGDAFAQTRGCTDPAAINYNVSATQNDGTCTYASTGLNAAQIAQLSDTIRETSGLVYWNGHFWTHNDDTDTTLYALDTADGHIVQRIAIAGAQNQDWEELTQDEEYFYLGDFGNNVNGNRQNLVILRLAKASLQAGQTTVTPDKIFFSYADQTSFTATGNNNTDFDCEAFIATGDSLYLFTKQWVSGHTKIYALPKNPGTYSAMPQSEYNIDGLITGATYLAAKRVVVLTGYKIASLLFQPFLWMLYDFPDVQHLLGGNKRKVMLNPQYHQTEAIATTDGHRFYITNEKLTQSVITITPKLQRVDLSLLLAPYYGSLNALITAPQNKLVTVYPNPAKGFFTAGFEAENAGKIQAGLYDALGRLVHHQTQSVSAGHNEMLIRPIRAGTGLFWLKLECEGHISWSRIVFEP